MVVAAKQADIPVGARPIGGDGPVGHRSYTRRWEGRPIESPDVQVVDVPLLLFIQEVTVGHDAWHAAE